MALDPNYWQSRMAARNAGTVTQVNDTDGTLLASRNPIDGSPQQANGNGASSVLQAGLAQQAQDNAYPATSVVPVNTPSSLPGVSGTSITYAPWSVGQGSPNFTPYGTVSSTGPAKTVAPAQPLDISQTPQGQAIQRIQAAATANGGSLAPLTPVQQPQGPQPTFPALAVNPSNPGTENPGYQAWEDNQNAQRAQNGLGPLSTAFQDFVTDQNTNDKTQQMAQELFNSHMRTDRLNRIATSGYRNAAGVPTATRTSGIDPNMAQDLQGQDLGLARQLVAGGNPDLIASNYQNITNAAVAGAPVPKSPDQIAAFNQINGQQQDQQIQGTKFNQEEGDRAAGIGLAQTIATAKTPLDIQAAINKYPTGLNDMTGRIAAGMAATSVAKGIENTDTARTLAQKDPVANQYAVQQIAKGTAPLDAYRQGIDFSQQQATTNELRQNFSPEQINSLKNQDGSYDMGKVQQILAEHNAEKDQFAPLRAQGAPDTYLQSLKTQDGRINPQALGQAVAYQKSVDNQIADFEKQRQNFLKANQNNIDLPQVQQLSDKISNLGATRFTGGYVPNRKYGGKTFLGGDPNNADNWR